MVQKLAKCKLICITLTWQSDSALGLQVGVLAPQPTCVVFCGAQMRLRCPRALLRTASPLLRRAQLRLPRLRGPARVCKRRVPRRHIVLQLVRIADRLRVCGARGSGGCSRRVDLRQRVAQLRL